MQKRKSVIIVFMCVVIAGLLVCCVCLYSQLGKERRLRGYDNYNYWYGIERMTGRVGNAVSTYDIEVLSRMFDFENVVTYYMGVHVEPMFRSETIGLSDFLTMSYDFFLSVLVDGSIPEKFLQEGMELFAEMNEELHRIAGEAIGRNEFDFVTGDEQGRIGWELIDEKSERHKRIAEMNAAFCETYEKRIEQFMAKVKSEG